MFPLPHGAAWQTLFLICGFLLIEEIRSEARIVCYYTNWSVYRPGTAKFSPQNINPYLCTHLIYAFGGFTKDNTLKPFDKYQDIEQGGYAKFTGLKSYNKNLKTLLAIGGWNEGSSRFSPLMASAERRQQFIKNVLKFLRQNHFDGLDLDWEYPVFRDGGKPRDKDNYAQFVEELRLEFDRESAKTGRPRLLLTMAVPAGIEYIEKGYDIPKLNKYLDWFNILSYDFHSAYEPSVNHHSPLKSLEEDNEYNYDNELNIDYTIKYYLNAGAEKDKLVLGIPTYGRSYTLINEEDTDIGAAADGPGEQGDATREKGYLAYYEICQAIRDDPEWTVIQPNPKAMGPYAFRRNQWVGYDDEDIVRRKAEYVVENGLGGIMFWSIDNDDFRGTCSGKPYPLIEAGKEALLERLGVGDNEVARPSRPKKPSRSRSRQGSSSNRNKISDDAYSEKTTSAPKKRVTNRRRSSSTTTATQAPTTSTTPSYVGGRTTPEPPTTPDPGTDFKCEEEGFFPHPRDCKRYFWCLDSGPSNLGIVAHQFTCPSGLFFNTAADSCDFSRNVLCKKSTTTAKPTTQAKATTTTTTTTTTSSPKVITAATSRNTFARYTTTTTTTPEPDDLIDDEEYEDEEDEHDTPSKDSEEDPKVIKELIELIKKVGGLEELEKQLQFQEDGSMVIKNGKSQEVSTTPSSISKSLYNKVLKRPNSLNSLRNRFGVNRSSTSTAKPINNDDAYTETSSQPENKYSSVIRNSRPSPQNAGIEKLPEFEGFLKEKPKYVTISRTRPTQATSVDDDISSKFDNTEDDDSEEEDDINTAALSEKSNDFENSKPPTQTPTYVNIRRSRPTTTTTPTRNENEYVNDAADKDSVPETTSRSTYQSINRRKGTTENFKGGEVSAPQITSTFKYKTIERSRPSLQTTSEDTSTSLANDLRNHRHASEDDVTPSVTVQFSDLNQYTKSYPTQQKLDTTTSRTYANIPRRTTTTTIASPVFSTVVVSDATATTISPPPPSLELITTSQQPIITTSTIASTLLSSSYKPSQTSITTPSTENYSNPKSTEHILINNEIHQNENTLRPNTNYHHNTIPSSSSSSSSGLDTEVYDTTILTNDKNTETSSHKIDEVTLTDNNNNNNNNNSNGKKKVVVIDINNSNIVAKLNTNTNIQSSPKDTNIKNELNNLSEINVDSKNHQLIHDFDVQNTERTLLSSITPTVATTTIATEKTTIKTTRPTRITTTTASQKQTTNDIEITVSSPRPFGFPRRRTRPTIIRKTSTTTNLQNLADTSSTDTNTSSLITKKVSSIPTTNKNLNSFKINNNNQSKVINKKLFSNVINNENVNSNRTKNINVINNNPHDDYSHNSIDRNRRENVIVREFTTNPEPTKPDNIPSNYPSSTKKIYSWKDKRIGNFRPWRTTSTTTVSPENSNNYYRIRELNSSSRDEELKSELNYPHRFSNNKLRRPTEKPVLEENHSDIKQKVEKDKHTSSSKLENPVAPKTVLNNTQTVFQRRRNGDRIRESNKTKLVLERNNQIVKLNSSVDLSNNLTKPEISSTLNSTNQNLKSSSLLNLSKNITEPLKVHTQIEENENLSENFTKIVTQIPKVENSSISSSTDTYKNITNTEILDNQSNLTKHQKEIVEHITKKYAKIELLTRNVQSQKTKTPEVEKSNNKTFLNSTNNNQPRTNTFELGVLNSTRNEWEEMERKKKPGRIMIKRRRPISLTIADEAVPTYHSSSNKVWGFSISSNDANRNNFHAILPNNKTQETTTQDSKFLRNEEHRHKLSDHTTKINYPSTTVIPTFNLSTHQDRRDKIERTTTESDFSTIPTTTIKYVPTTTKEEAEHKTETSSFSPIETTTINSENAVEQRNSKIQKIYFFSTPRFEESSSNAFTETQDSFTSNPIAVSEISQDISTTQSSPRFTTVPKFTHFYWNYQTTPRIKNPTTSFINFETKRNTVPITSTLRYDVSTTNVPKTSEAFSNLNPIIVNENSQERTTQDIFDFQTTTITTPIKTEIPEVNQISTNTNSQNLTVAVYAENISKTQHFVKEISELAQKRGVKIFTQNEVKDNSVHRFRLTNYNKTDQLNRSNNSRKPTLRGKNILLNSETVKTENQRGSTRFQHLKKEQKTMETQKPPQREFLRNIFSVPEKNSSPTTESTVIKSSDLNTNLKSKTTENSVSIQNEQATKTYYEDEGIKSSTFSPKNLKTTTNTIKLTTTNDFESTTSSEEYTTKSYSTRLGFFQNGPFTTPHQNHPSTTEKESTTQVNLKTTTNSREEQPNFHFQFKPNGFRFAKYDFTTEIPHNFQETSLSYHPLKLTTEINFESTTKNSVDEITDPFLSLTTTDNSFPKNIFESTTKNLVDEITDPFLSLTTTDNSFPRNQWTTENPNDFSTKFTPNSKVKTATKIPQTTSHTTSTSLKTTKYPNFFKRATTDASNYITTSIDPETAEDQYKEDILEHEKVENKEFSQRQPKKLGYPIRDNIPVLYFRQRIRNKDDRYAKKVGNLTSDEKTEDEPFVKTQKTLKFSENFTDTSESLNLNPINQVTPFQILVEDKISSTQSILNLNNNEEKFPETTTNNLFHTTLENKDHTDSETENPFDSNEVTTVHSIRSPLGIVEEEYPSKTSNIVEFETQTVGSVNKLNQFDVTLLKNRRNTETKTKNKVELSSNFKSKEDENLQLYFSNDKNENELNVYDLKKIKETKPQRQRKTFSTEFKTNDILTTTDGTLTTTDRTEKSGSFWKFLDNNSNESEKMTTITTTVNPKEFFYTTTDFNDNIQEIKTVTHENIDDFTTTSTISPTSTNKIFFLSDTTLKSVDELAATVENSNKHLSKPQRGRYFEKSTTPSQQSTASSKLYDRRQPSRTYQRHNGDNSFQPTEENLNRIRSRFRPSYNRSSISVTEKNPDLSVETSTQEQHSKPIFQRQYSSTTQNRLRNKNFEKSTVESITTSPERDIDQVGISTENTKRETLHDTTLRSSLIFPRKSNTNEKSKANLEEDENESSVEKVPDQDISESTTLDNDDDGDYYSDNDISTIRNTLIFLKGPKPTQTTEFNVKDTSNLSLKPPTRDRTSGFNYDSYRTTELPSETEQPNTEKTIFKNKNTLRFSNDESGLKISTKDIKSTTQNIEKEQRNQESVFGKKYKTISRSSPSTQNSLEYEDTTSDSFTTTTETSTIASLRGRRPQTSRAFSTENYNAKNNENSTPLSIFDSTTNKKEDEEEDEISTTSFNRLFRGHKKYSSEEQETTTEYEFTTETIGSGFTTTERNMNLRSRIVTTTETPEEKSTTVTNSKNTKPIKILSESDNDNLRQISRQFSRSRSRFKDSTDRSEKNDTKLVEGVRSNSRISTNRPSVFPQNRFRISTTTVAPERSTFRSNRYNNQGQRLSRFRITTTTTTTNSPTSLSDSVTTSSEFPLEIPHISSSEPYNQSDVNTIDNVLRVKTANNFDVNGANESGEIDVQNVLLTSVTNQNQTDQLKNSILLNVNRHFQNSSNKYLIKTNDDGFKGKTEQVINNSSTDSPSVILNNGKRVRIIKKRRRPSNNSVSNINKEEEKEQIQKSEKFTKKDETSTQSSRPRHFRKTLVRRRPLTSGTSTTSTTSPILNSTTPSEEKQNVSEESKKRYKKVLRRKRPIENKLDMSDDTVKDISNKTDQTNYSKNTTFPENENKKDEIIETQQVLLTKTKLTSSRKPYRPTKPSLSAITSTEATSIATPRNYVRKYSSNFTLPKLPSELTQTPQENERPSILLKPLKLNRQRYKARKPIFKTNHDDDDENTNSYNINERVNRFENRIRSGRPLYTNSYQDRRTDQSQDKEEDDEYDFDEEEFPDYVSPVTDSNIIKSTSPNILAPNLVVRLNNGFIGYVAKPLPGENDENIKSIDGDDDDEEEINEDQNEYNDELSDIKEEEPELFESPFSTTSTTTVQPTTKQKTSNRPAILRPSRPTNKPRVINRPIFTTIHPASLKTTSTGTIDITQSTTPLPTTQKLSNTRQYTRPYSSTASTENTLLEEIQIDALNARNKKIFDISSKKHTTIRPNKQIQKENSNQNYTITSSPPQQQQQQQQQQNNTHLENSILVDSENLNNFDTLQENVLENSITPSTTTRRPTSSTTTKITTLHHVFAIDENEETTMPTSSTSTSTTKKSNKENIIKESEKLVEINRVVEVYSKEDKLKLKANSNDSEKITSTDLKIEKLPTIDKLGEISRVKLVKLVESSEIQDTIGTRSKLTSLGNNGELVIESRSTVADYTPTEATTFIQSVPVRNVIPIINTLDNDVSANDKRPRKLATPEVILGVETSTIALEGLFESARKAKNLEEPVYASSLGEIQTIIPSTESPLEITTQETTTIATLAPTTQLTTTTPIPTPTPTPTTTTTTTTTSKPKTTEKNKNYVRPLVPLLRPESNESSPLVISIANLDKVILSKVPKTSDSNAAFSGQINTFIQPPIPLLNNKNNQENSENATLDTLEKNSNGSSINSTIGQSTQRISSSSSSSSSSETKVIQTQTSYSSETKVIRMKRPRKSKSRKNQKHSKKTTTIATTTGIPTTTTTTAIESQS